MIILRNKYKEIPYNSENVNKYKSSNNLLRHAKTDKDVSGIMLIDKNIRNYCNSSGIILIEIPFTYYNQKRISSLLDEIVLNNKNPNDLITIPPINYYRTKKDREEAMKDGRL